MIFGNGGARARRDREVADLADGLARHVPHGLAEELGDEEALVRGDRGGARREKTARHHAGIVRTRASSTTSGNLRGMSSQFPFRGRAPGLTRTAVRTFRVGKGVQAALLASYSFLLLAVTLLVQGGGAVRTNLAPFDDIQRLILRAGRNGYLSNAFLYAIVGIVGNLAMFAGWAFLLWKFLDGPGRSALRNHGEVLLAGTLLSVGIETVQLFLPSRATDVNDVFWNVLGTVAGCVAAHLHRNVRLDWQ